jgi:hypothetical protein
MELEGTFVPFVICGCNFGLKFKFHYRHSALLLLLCCVSILLCQVILLCI